MLVEHGRDRGRVLAVPVHPDREGLDAAQHEVRVERAGHRAHRVLQERDAVAELGVGDRDEPAQGVGVAAQVLRGGVHDDVGAERERALEIRRGEGVVDHDARAARVRDARDGVDVDDAERGVRRRLDPHDPRLRADGPCELVGIRQVGRGPVDPGLGVHPGNETERAAVRVEGQDHVMAGTEQRAQDRVLRGHPAREREAARPHPRASRGTPPARRASGCRSGRTRSRRACRRRPGRTSWRG